MHFRIRAVLFLLNGFIAAGLAFTVFVGGAEGTAKTLFYISIVICAVLLLAELSAFLKRVQASFEMDG